MLRFFFIFNKKMKKAIFIILAVLVVTYSYAQEQKETYYSFAKGNIKESGQVDKSGHAVGEWKFYLEDGTLEYIINFTTNYTKSFYETGELKETYNFNPLTGAYISDWTSYYKNGAISAVGKYNNDGKKNGVFKTYLKNGTLKYTETYREGVKL